MRLVLLQSAIQNPESRIQNHVSALRRSQLGHGHGQAIGAGMDDSAPWKTEETIIGHDYWWLSPFLSPVFPKFGGCLLFFPDPVCQQKGLSARRIELASVMRSLGSRARHCSMTVARGCGTSGRRMRRGTGCSSRSMRIRSPPPAGSSYIYLHVSK